MDPPRMQAVLLQVTLPQSSARLRQAFHCFSETNTSQEVLRGADGIFWNIFFSWPHHYRGYLIKHRATLKSKDAGTLSSLCCAGPRLNWF